MIRADSVRYSVGEFDLDVTLEVKDGEYFVLLGSTGSGKTLFLECLCGLRPPRSGRVLVNGEDVTGWESAERKVGYVPQDGVLFTHLDVRGNIAFCLRVSGAGRSERDRAAEELARMLGIERLLGRRIPGLSGGERQRVALARALACKPSMLLLDEPVSALDEFTRDAICRELVRLQRQTGVSVIHVCHSFEEARLVADRIGVIGAGRIVQTGTPDELMREPANRYVAKILRLENIFAGRAERAGAGALIQGAGFRLSGPAAEGEVEFLVRPWDIHLADGQPGGRNTVEGCVSEFSLAGPVARVRIDGPLPLLALLTRAEALGTGLGKGRTVRLAFGADAIHVFRETSTETRAGST